MATQQAVMAVQIVNTSNQIIESTGAAGSATRQPMMTVKIVNSSGTVIP